MAVNNRSEATSQVNALIVPTVTNATHKTLLNDNILNSIVFRKDVQTTIVPAGGVMIADYSATDLVKATTSGNLAVTITGLENGDVKYLYIAKDLTDSVSFTGGVVDNTLVPTYVQNDLTAVVYEVINKNGIVFVNAINKNLFPELTSSVGDSLKTYVTPQAFNNDTTMDALTATMDGAWSTAGGVNLVWRMFSGLQTVTNKYRNQITLEIEAEFTGSASIGDEVNVCTLPFSSSYQRYFNGVIVKTDAATGDAYPVPIRMEATSGILSLRNIPVALTTGDWIMISTSFYHLQT